MATIQLVRLHLFMCERILQFICVRRCLQYEQKLEQYRFNKMNQRLKVVHTVPFIKTVQY